MSKMTDIIAELEVKFARLIRDMKQLEDEKKALSNQLKTEKEVNNKLVMQRQTLHQQIDDLKTSNALLGSEEYKRETKLKINSLVREIDHCITQLSD